MHKTQVGSLFSKQHVYILLSRTAFSLHNREGTNRCAERKADTV